MPDNTTVDNGTLTDYTVSDEELGDGSHLQSVELHSESAGTKTKFGTASNPIRVDPTGSTTQPVSIAGTVPVSDAGGSLTVDDGGGSLTVDGTVAISGTVVISDGAGAITVDGSVTADTELPAAVALADNTANPTVPGVGAFLMGFDGTNWDRVRADGGALFIQDGGNSITVDATNLSIRALDVATDDVRVGGMAAQDAAVADNPVAVGGRASSAVPTAMSADGDAVFLWLDRSGGVVMNGRDAHDAALNANTNPFLAGARASAAAPTDVSADGDAVRLWALRSGALATVLTAAGALIGGDATNGLDVDVTRVSGSVTVAQATASNLNAEVQGDAAHDAAVSGNPLTVGGRASTAVPTAVSADGDAVWAWYDRRGAAKVVLVDDAGDSVMDGTNDALRVNVVAGSGGATQYAEDTASAAGESVIMVGVVRKDSAASLVDADSDRTELQVDASGALRVTGGGGGTEYTEDVAAPGDPVGGATLLRRRDTPASEVTTAGDWIAANANQYGAQYVQVVTSAGAFVDGFGGGTQYAEDTASAAAEQLTMAGVVRKDSAASLVDTDGDRTELQVNATGELRVSASGTVSISGAVIVGDGGGSITVDGTVDTELPTPITPGDSDANPTAPEVVARNAVWTGSAWARIRSILGDGVAASGSQNVSPMLYNGTNYDRMRGDSANGADVDVTRMPGTRQGTGSLTALDSAVTVTPGNAEETWHVVTSGTYTATYLFEGTVDGSTWFALRFLKNQGTTSEDLDQAGQTTSDEYVLNVAGYQQVRIRCSAYTSGTINVAWSIGAGSGRLAQVYGFGLSGEVPIDIARVGGLQVSSVPIQASDGTSAIESLLSGADNTSNTLNELITAAFGYVFDGSTWDRLRGDSVGGVFVQGPVASGGAAPTNPVFIAGVNGSGNVTVPTIGSGASGAGAIRVTPATNDTFPVQGIAGGVAIEAVGDVAQDAAIAGNPLPAGGRASSAVPTAMSADGDSVYRWLDRSGGTIVNGRDAHDAALDANTNPQLIGGRASAAAPTDVSADGDAVRAWFLRNGAQAAVLTAAGALIGGDATNGLDVDVTRVGGSVSVIGAAAQDAAISGNPVPAGWRASTAVPTAMSADGDVVYPWANRSGAPVVTAAPHVGLNSDPWNLVHEAAQYTTTQTSTVLVAGGASEKIVVTKVQIQVGGTTAGTLQLYFGTGAFSRGTSRAIFDGEFAPSATLKPGVIMDGPFIAGTNGDDLMVTTSAAINPLTINVWYYVVT